MLPIYPPAIWSIVFLLLIPFYSNPSGFNPTAMFSFADRYLYPSSLLSRNLLIFQCYGCLLETWKMLLFFKIIYVDVDYIINSADRFGFLSDLLFLKVTINQIFRRAFSFRDTCNCIVEKSLRQRIKLCGITKPSKLSLINSCNFFLLWAF